MTGVSGGAKNRKVNTANKSTKEPIEKAKMGPKLKINVLPISRKEPTMPPAKVKKLAANGKFLGVAYFPSKEIAGERNIVIANAQAIKTKGKIPLITSVGGMKVTTQGMAINKLEAKIAPAEIKGKRLPTQRKD